MFKPKYPDRLHAVTWYADDQRSYSCRQRLNTGPDSISADQRNDAASQEYRYGEKPHK